MFTDNLAFLRVVRMLRLLRSYRVLRELREVSPFFTRNEEIIHSSINLFVFIFVVTAVVYVVEGRINPKINNYFDALYFTVTTLTTTGFGDITMTDTAGKMLAVIIMILGVALFLRLIQTIFRPQKVAYPCPECGLETPRPRRSALQTLRPRSEYSERRLRLTGINVSVTCAQVTCAACFSFFRGRPPPIPV